jgi:hypothetical protein
MLPRNVDCAEIDASAITGDLPVASHLIQSSILTGRSASNRARRSAIPWTSAANDASASGERANSGVTLVPTMAFSANR